MLSRCKTWWDPCSHEGGWPIESLMRGLESPGRGEMGAGRRLASPVHWRTSTGVEPTANHICILASPLFTYTCDWQGAEETHSRSRQVTPPDVPLFPKTCRQLLPRASTTTALCRHEKVFIHVPRRSHAVCCTKSSICGIGGLENGDMAPMVQRRSVQEGLPKEGRSCIAAKCYAARYRPGRTEERVNIRILLNPSSSRSPAVAGAAALLSSIPPSKPSLSLFSRVPPVSHPQTPVNSNRFGSGEQYNPPEALSPLPDTRQGLGSHEAPPPRVSTNRTPVSVTSTWLASILSSVEGGNGPHLPISFSAFPPSSERPTRDFLGIDQVLYVTTDHISAFYPFSSFFLNAHPFTPMTPFGAHPRLTISP